MSLKPSTITPEARANAPISAATIVGVSALYVFLCTVFTAARMYTRFSVHQQFWWDDWTMLLAWAGTVALNTLLIVMVQHGGGMNISDVPTADYKIFSTIWLDSQMVARTSIFFVKLSILLLYIRVFFPKGTYRTSFWWVIQAVAWLNFLYTVSLILAIALQCVPYGLPFGNSCVNQYGVLISASVINIVSDIAVLIIPMGSLWRLRMDRRRKLALWALFAFGALAPVASVARLAYQVPVANGANKTVIYPIVLLLATAEQVISVVAGCVPVTSAWFYRRILNKARSNTPESKPKTITERFWPNRESRPDSPGQRKRSGASDPYRITEATTTGFGSEEILHTHTASADSPEAWQLKDNTRDASP